MLMMMAVTTVNATMTTAIEPYLMGCPDAYGSTILLAFDEMEVLRMMLALLAASRPIGICLESISSSASSLSTPSFCLP